jgi:parallel beta-helix repeat protein
MKIVAIAAAGLLAEPRVVEEPDLGEHEGAEIPGQEQHGWSLWLARTTQACDFPSMRWLGHWVLVSLAAVSVSTGCGGDDDGSGGNGGSGGSGAGGGTIGVCGEGVATADDADCVTVLEASGGDDTEAVQTALIEAQSGDVVCFCPGDYSFTKELSLTVPDVTVKGVGETRDDVVLDFAAQNIGDDGVTVTSDGFTVASLTIKNTPGNGIVVTGAEDVTFRDLMVSWDAGSVTENGAYAVYPVKSTNVIVEDSEVIGAADAGIYVGQCENAIVRNNVVHGNVAGIEIENSSNAEVVGNEAFDNTAGVLVFVLPNLERKEGDTCKVHDNDIYDNNRSNFGEEGTVVASVPAGTGVLVLGSDAQEIHDNRISGNNSTALLLVSHATLGLLIPGFTPDPETDGDPEGTYFHDNELMDNGTQPSGAVILLGAGSPIPDVVWDGIEKMPGSAELCLGSSPASFLNFGGVDGVGDPTLHSNDTTPHECVGEEQPTVSL